MGHTFNANIPCEECFISGHGQIHLMIGLTINGEGPAEGKDFHHFACWCCDPYCGKWRGTWNDRAMSEMTQNMKDAYYGPQD